MRSLRQEKALTWLAKVAPLGDAVLAWIMTAQSSYPAPQSLPSRHTLLLSLATWLLYPQVKRYRESSNLNILTMLTVGNNFVLGANTPTPARIWRINRGLQGLAGTEWVRSEWVMEFSSDQTTRIPFFTGACSSIWQGTISFRELVSVPRAGSPFNQNC